MFKNDLEAIERLRTDAINVVEPHVSGLLKLGKYAAQLRWIMGKFPIDIGADFTWYMALGYNTQRSVTQNNLQFEWANILYNLASLYSKLACSCTRITTEGLKTAYNYFACAAGVIKYLKEEVIPELRSSPPEDLDAMTLEALEQLMLAQAQECFWQKAVLDGNRDAIIARLAEQVGEYYKAAEEFGVKSNAISGEWIHRISAKRYHMAAAAQYRAACDCLERSKYGEEIARLEAALAHVKNAVVEGKYLTKAYLADLTGFQSKLVGNLKRANKDNDMIYLSPVPPASALLPIQKATMAKSTVPKEITEARTNLTETGPYGAPLFAKLVPFAVHIAASIYAEKRDKLVENELIGEFEALTTKLHDVLQSLNLPGSLQALEKSLGLPSGVVAHAEEVKSQDGLARIRRSIDDIAKLKANNVAMYQEAVEMLSSEETADRLLREKHGTARWTRLASRAAAPQLYEELEEYAGYMKSAEQSDNLVREKVKEHEAVLRVLGSDLSEVEAFVPNTQRVKMTPKMEREVARLRNCLNEVSRLESGRRRTIEAVREKARTDDITTDILQETAHLERTSPHTKIEPFHFETLFETRLTTRYSSERNLLQNESLEQSQLESRLRESNTAFLAYRKTDTATKEREAALQALESGYFKYREIVQNLDTGRKFYNDLAKLLGQWRERVKGRCLERMDEARVLEGDLVAGVGNMRISGGGGSSIGGENEKAPKRTSIDVEAALKTLQPAQVQTSPRQMRSGERRIPVSLPAVVPQQVVAQAPPTPPPTVRPIALNGPPSTPLPAPKPTRIVPPPQVPSPMPGLWMGNGMTPLRFAGELPEASRKTPQAKR